MADIRAWARRRFGATKEGTAPPSPRPAPQRAADRGAFAAGHNDFALALYEPLRQRHPGNLFFSPWSVRAALAMACAGARGETAAQMSTALRLPPSDASLHGTLGEVIASLNTEGCDYELAVANSLWSQDGAPLRQEFLELIARNHGSARHVVDFQRHAESARAKINAWVEDRTKKKIQGLIPPHGLGPDTRMVLVNAVYFKGTWALQFPKSATLKAPFHLQGGGRVQAPLMHLREEVRYLQGQSFQAVDLDYEGGDLSMLVLLPERKSGLRDLETSLSASMLHACVAQMQAREVKLFLPRFKITWGTADLTLPLRALGIQRAFAQLEADFSGINGLVPPQEGSLFLSAVYHKAFVEVNEAGTEAAAATAADWTLCMESPRQEPPIAVFRADHPFVFAIRERQSGVLLFLGRVSDPTRLKN